MTHTALAPLAQRTSPRADAEAARVARIADVTLQQLGTLADYTETLARGYVAQGATLTDAMARATDETIAMARTLGLAL